MIEVQGLSKRFKDVHALVDVTLYVNEREVVGLVGPNGAGKTTLFRILAGVIKADRGTVCIDGLEPRKNRLEVLTGLGIVPENRGLYLRLTLREQLEVFAALHGLHTPWLEERIEVLVDTFGLQNLLDRPCHSLSQGQQVRLTLGQALLHSPRNLILDEPTRGLDVLGIRSVRTMIEQEKSKGTCILLSSHSMSDLTTLCDRLVILNKGRVLCSGTLLELRSKTNLSDIEDILLHAIEHDVTNV